MNAFKQAIEKAESMGHELVSDPPMMATVSRYTCRNCGQAVLGTRTFAYGSAIETGDRCNGDSTREDAQGQESGT